ncbi:MAG: transposase [Bacteroidota bacterium]
MSSHSQQFLSENYYHLYNRGNNKQHIFLEDQNYRFFLKQLHHYFDPQGVELDAYCLMPNHYHLLIRLEHEVDFSNLMRSFSTSYVKSFNSWHNRTGHLFEGNFRARLIDEDRYLTHLCRYIHLNPVTAGFVQFPQDWQYSDYVEWISDSAPDNLPNIRVRKQFFGTAQDYQSFVMDYAGEEKVRKEIERRLFG